MNTTVEKVLLEGNIAVAEAAIIAGVDCYFGYPITPQSEIGEYMSAKMPELGRVFIPAESEVAAINMCLGCGSTGKYAMTSSSSCAIALMQEGLSFIATDEIPAVIVSVMRGGPGLGYIFPSQGDYNQTTRGGGNGDYKIPSYAPSSVQEAIELTYKTFYIAQKYRTPVFLLMDGMLGQIKEPAVLSKNPYPRVDNSAWALTGAKERGARSIKSIVKTTDALYNHIEKLFKKYDEIAQNEVMYEEYMTEDAQVAVCAFGSTARIAKSAIKTLRKEGLKIGMFRPITLWPFPYKQINKLSQKVNKVITIELNKGQMLDDVKLGVNGMCPVEFYGRGAGDMFTSEELTGVLRNACI